MRPKEYVNEAIYKEITKWYHDNYLVRREFQVGQKVLLYDSRLRLFPRKLKSRWSEPFIVNKVFANGAVEVQDPIDLHIFIVNDQKLKIYGSNSLLVLVSWRVFVFRPCIFFLDKVLKC